MMNYPPLTPSPTSRETKLGLIWLAATTLVLPSLLSEVNRLLPHPLSLGMLNFVFYLVNFCVTAAIFHHFLRSAAAAALDRLFPVIWYAVLAYLGNRALTEIVTVLIYNISPEFGNVNDASIFAMLEEDLIPLAMGTVFLVPLAEETMYRGLVFRKLFDRNPFAAYAISMAAFAAIHVMGYIGSYPPLQLLLCFLQYLPAGYCLCWCYRQTGTIVSPILMHTLVNATSIYYYVR